MADEVKIKISADSTAFDKGVAAVKAGFSNINKSALSFSSVAGGAFSSFLGNLSANAVSSAFSALKNGFSSAIGSVKEFTQLAGVQEDAVNKLNTSLALTGKFSLETSKDIQSFASELQNTSRFGDELILKNAALIQSFGNLDSEGLKRATRAAADFATATGKGFDEASALIAKASTGQVEALKRYGIQVENTGNRVKDFESAILQLENKFGGSALTALNTFSGAQQSTNNIIGDFKEELGAVITQNPVFIAAIKGIGDSFKILQTEVSNNKEAIQGFVNDGIGLFVKGIGFAGDSINFFLDLSSGINSFFAEITDLSLATGQTFASFAKTLVDSSVSVTDFLGTTTEAQRSAQSSLKTTIQVFEQARISNEEKTLADISSNEKFKDSISSVTERIQQEINARIQAEAEGGEIERIAQLEKLNNAALARQTATEAELALKEENNAAFLAQQETFFGAEQAQITKLNIDKLANEGKFNEALLKLRDARQKGSQAEIALEQKKQSEIIGIAQASSNFLQAIDGSKNKAIFLAQKALAAAQIVIQGTTAASAAIAPPPIGAGPIAGIPLATLIKAKTGIALATVAAQTITGLNKGGEVEGGNIFGDSTLAALTKGEIVAPRKDFDDVVEGTARQRGFVKQEEVEATQAESISINISGDVIGDELFINNLIEKIRDAVQFRNADLGVS